MTIVVTVKINDGIVLASDRATTFSDDKGVVFQVYNNANKVFNLVKGEPIGALTWGAGGLGSASISTISKDLPPCASLKSRARDMRVMDRAKKEMAPEMGPRCCGGRRIGGHYPNEAARRCPYQSSPRIKSKPSSAPPAHCHLPTMLRFSKK